MRFLDFAQELLHTFTHSTHTFVVRLKINHNDSLNISLKIDPFFVLPSEYLALLLVCWKLETALYRVYVIFGYKYYRGTKNSESRSTTKHKKLSKTRYVFMRNWISTVSCVWTLGSSLARFPVAHWCKVHLSTFRWNIIGTKASYPHIVCVSVIAVDPCDGENITSHEN